MLNKTKLVENQAKFTCFGEGRTQLLQGRVNEPRCLQDPPSNKAGTPAQWWKASHSEPGLAPTRERA